MAGSFVGSNAAPAKSKRGSGGMDQARARQKAKPEYPITNSFAATTIPKFATRHCNTNAKTGFHCKPARPPAGRLAERPSSPSRGSGKEHRAKG